MVLLIAVLMLAQCVLNENDQHQIGAIVLRSLISVNFTTKINHLPLFRSHINIVC